MIRGGMPQWQLPELHPSGMSASNRAPSGDGGERTLQRLERLTEVVYGLTLLLLLFQLRRPDPALLATSTDLHKFLLDQLPSLRIYITSFVLVVFYWQSHLGLFSRFRKSDGVLVWLQLGSLMGVALLPFVNDLLEDFPIDATVQVIYSVVLVYIGVFDILTLIHAWRCPDLLDQPLPSGRLIHVVAETAAEPLVCGASIGVTLLISPAWWEWTFLLLIPAYGLLWLSAKRGKG